MRDVVGLCVKCQEYQARKDQGFVCPVCRDIERQRQKRRLLKDWKPHPRYL